MWLYPLSRIITFIRFRPVAEVSTFARADSAFDGDLASAAVHEVLSWASHVWIVGVDIPRDSAFSSNSVATSFRILTIWLISCSSAWWIHSIVPVFSRFGLNAIAAALDRLLGAIAHQTWWSVEVCCWLVSAKTILVDHCCSWRSSSWACTSRLLGISAKAWWSVVVFTVWRSVVVIVELVSSILWPSSTTGVQFTRYFCSGSILWSGTRHPASRSLVTPVIAHPRRYSIPRIRRNICASNTSGCGPTLGRTWQQISFWSRQTLTFTYYIESFYLMQQIVFQLINLDPHLLVVQSQLLELIIICFNILLFLGNGSLVPFSLFF